ncbi:hypothetical protein KAFR_0E01360 [Kazachstania africana CBS 2517]|uniref:Large ribosomal subunit protein mL67 n=1 Tax=Kazachstania africana (strain ATCC 22294 / BCRC 22015 / CBS 2517 / CECT 1963 / NBRC 1671 / NRRL Y-8276) TaxID=1071382 RepID=H2AV90_KAZAF|nr:hypothetical protein KAFR_0E01360 [Kazachstania africana CBS 2517]CCF58290.1 hypothetical protein KAFR_0E01360 [Kazachstania africana CBS 2517]
MNKFRTAKWLKTHNFAPQVYIYRNLELGSTVYTQVPTISQYNIGKCFPRTSWNNPLPSKRRDLWKLMCLVNCNDYDRVVKLYQNLVRLRYLRDVMSKRGNVWYSGLYRPIYAQETVADLRESILNLEECALKDTDDEMSIYWGDNWRMGEKETWWDCLPQVKHNFIPKNCNNSREESNLIKEISEYTLKSLVNKKKLMYIYIYIVKYLHLIIYSIFESLTLHLDPLFSRRFPAPTLP